MVNQALHEYRSIMFRYSCPHLNLTEPTKTVTLNIQNKKTITVTGLPMDTSLYDVMQQAENEGKLT